MALVIPNLATISLRNTRNETDKVAYSDAERDLAKKAVSIVLNAAEIKCDLHEDPAVLAAIEAGMANPRNKGAPSLLGHIRHGFEAYADQERAKGNKAFSVDRCYAAILGLLKTEARKLNVPKDKFDLLFGTAPEKGQKTA